MRLYGMPPGDRPIPRRPFRDSAILYAVLSGLILLVSLVTGGGIARAIVVAVVFFVLATAWSWWRFSVRLREGGRR